MTIDEFSQVELKIGLIRTAERIEGSDKLLKLTVDLGEENPRQILSGIAKQYEPEELVGMQALFVTNLDPRMMMGMESQGMLLAANDEFGPILLSPRKEVAPGTKIH